jgi:hypothetical protein
MLMPESNSMLYHVECSFFSWFSDTQDKDDLDDIHDEVSSIFVYKFDQEFSFNVGGTADVFIIILIIVTITATLIVLL